MPMSSGDTCCQATSIATHSFYTICNSQFWWSPANILWETDLKWLLVWEAYRLRKGYWVFAWRVAGHDPDITTCQERPALLTERQAKNFVWHVAPLWNNRQYTQDLSEHYTTTDHYAECGDGTSLDELG